MKPHKIMTLDGEEYVLVPRAEYLSMTGTPPDAVEAVPFARVRIGMSLRAAREHAGFTQGELAAKLKKSQPMVSGAETGTVSVGAAYVASVLKACGLPKDWSLPATGATPPAGGTSPSRAALGSGTGRRPTGGGGVGVRG